MKLLIFFLSPNSAHTNPTEFNFNFTFAITFIPSFPIRPLWLTFRVRLKLRNVCWPYTSPTELIVTFNGAIVASNALVWLLHGREWADSESNLCPLFMFTVHSLPHRSSISHATSTGTTTIFYRSQHFRTTKRMVSYLNHDPNGNGKRQLDCYSILNRPLTLIWIIVLNWIQRMEIFTGRRHSLHPIRWTQIQSYRWL